MKNNIFTALIAMLLVFCMAMPALAEAASIEIVEPAAEPTATPEPQPVEVPANVSLAYRDGSINLRAGAGTKYKVIGSLRNGTAFTVTKSSGNWYRVKVIKSGKVGWVSKSYTAKGAYAKVTTEYQGLNVRTGPGTGYAIKGSMPLGARNVKIKYINGNWAYVSYKGLNGWSSRTYLKWMA